MSDLHDHLAAAARNGREAARHADDAVRHSRTAVVGFVIVTIGLLLQVLGMVAARAADDVIVIPVDNVVRAPEGSHTVVATADVPAGQQGASCLVDTRGENGLSVHPNNDLIVASNGSSVVLPDIEREPGAVTTASGRVELGTSIVVTLRMGPHEVHSGGLTVTLDCDPPTTTETTAWTTTTAAPTTTTSSVPTESAPSTVTEPTEPTTTPTTTERPGTSTSTTTTPASSSSTSTVESSTSTSTPTTVSSSTSTEPEEFTPTTEPPTLTGQQLPRTGATTNALAVVGLVLIGVGGSLVLVERVGFGHGR
ncbi:MAG: LPXTG cell wall anchor domain-containing protein [Actinomycetota bacterium]